MLNRVAGYSGFDNLGVTGVCALKPGQTTHNRDYYKHANTTKATGGTYLNTYSRFSSNHQQTLDKAVKPSDYKKGGSGNQNIKYEYLHNPELFKYTKAGRQTQLSNPGAFKRAENELKDAGATSSDKLYKTTKHWRSNYASENTKTQERPHSQAQRPFWSYPKREHVARRTFFKTESQNRFGDYGSNPLKTLHTNPNLFDSEKSDLTMGTSKVTRHVPGY